MTRDRTPPWAFTLIELLVVVAVIAILAAIALPNLLEAQSRAKVARVKADLRTVAVALEAYRVDQNAYPPSVDRTSPNFAPLLPRIRRFPPLTTPIGYLTGAVTDVFSQARALPGYAEGDQRALSYWGPDYLTILPNGEDWCQQRAEHYFPEFPEISDGHTLKRIPLWSVLSLGPDADEDVMDFGWPTPIQPYDPTNGSLSDGDIIRFRE